MTYAQALRVKIGDTIIQTMYGYELVVKDIQEVKLAIGKPYVSFICTTGSGSEMKMKNREVSLKK